MALMWHVSKLVLLLPLGPSPASYWSFSSKNNPTFYCLLRPLGFQPPVAETDGSRLPTVPFHPGHAVGKGGSDGGPVPFVGIGKVKVSVTVSEPMDDVDAGATVVLNDGVYDGNGLEIESEHVPAALGRISDPILDVSVGCTAVETGDDDVTS